MTDKRTYRSPLRERRAHETRVAIVDAALERFFVKGYAATSIREIAERAGVSEQTVYSAFGDKPTLLRAAGDRWFTGDDHDAAALADTNIGGRLARERDLDARLRMALRFAFDAYDRGDFREVVDGAVAADPDLRDLVPWALNHSYANTRALLELALGDAVPAGPDREELMDLLWAVFNTEAIRRLLEHRGWSRRRAQDHLARLVHRLVQQTQEM